jgi:hypothetical protein
MEKIFLQSADSLPPESGKDNPSPANPDASIAAEATFGAHMQHGLGCRYHLKAAPPNFQAI